MALHRSRYTVQELWYREALPRRLERGVTGCRWAAIHGEWICIWKSGQEGTMTAAEQDLVEQGLAELTIGFDRISRKASKKF